MKIKDYLWCDRCDHGYEAKHINLIGNEKICDLCVGKNEVLVAYSRKKRYERCLKKKLKLY